jgi:hypothetical protein
LELKELMRSIKNKLLVKEAKKKAKEESKQA